jgi:hypothetical protein
MDAVIHRGIPKTNTQLDSLRCGAAWPWGTGVMTSCCHCLRNHLILGPRTIMGRFHCSNRFVFGVFKPGKGEFLHAYEHVRGFPVPGCMLLCATLSCFHATVKPFLPRSRNIPNDRFTDSSTNLHNLLFVFVCSMWRCPNRCWVWHKIALLMCVCFSPPGPLEYKPQKKRILNYGLSILSWELLKQAELCCFCLWKNMWAPMTLKRASYWLVVWSVCRFHPKCEDPFDSRWMAWKYQPLTLHLRENLNFYRKHVICSNVFHMLLHEMSSIFCLIFPWNQSHQPPRSYWRRSARFRWFTF